MGDLAVSGKSHAGFLYEEGRKTRFRKGPGNFLRNSPVPNQKNTNSHEIDVFLTERQLAERHQRSIKTLQNLRVSGGGIPYVKIGRAVRYRLADVVAWEDRNMRLSTSDGKVPA